MSIEHYRLKKMAALARGKSKLLDIGYAAMPNPYLQNSEVYGLDLNKPVQLPTNYIKIFQGNVFDLPKPFEENSFDAILAGEIIEHLEQPVEFLRLCNKTLKPGGLLVISTPNPNSIWEQILTLNLSRSFFFDPEHVCLYPQRWLIRMFELANFEKVKICSGGIKLPYTLTNIPFPRPWAEFTIVSGIKKK